ncbi:aldo/keto reductase [Anaerorhabdus furcosa]|uniref:Predicted oxidoreductase n=1 Tax=Anaerorhabdus furcosa TaxID=118967 RepID=A0A1T4K8K7_9FIRM|nr:aldo/keto reductase [Anaerorhabdus furcosa]SJZ38739.1 Predicted oxidoreductase [Anaerorhabdus furcosa]
MRYITINQDVPQCSEIGIGCMRINALSSSEVENLINTSLEVGINFFDHADIYGGGKSEELFGEWLQKNPEKRKDIVIQSKCGIRKGYYDFSKEYILESVEQILKRLKTDYLDILLLHRPDALMEVEEIAEAFNQLKNEGKVRAFGLSNVNAMQIELIQSELDQPILINQLQFSLAHTGLIDSGINANHPSSAGEARDGGTYEYCRLNNIILQAWSPLQYGFFEGTFLGNDLYPELNETINRLAAKYEVTPEAIAIAWILRLPMSVQAIVGSTNPQRIKNMAKATDIVLTKVEWYELYRSAGNLLP